MQYKKDLKKDRDGEGNRNNNDGDVNNDNVKVVAINDVHSDSVSGKKRGKHHVTVSNNVGNFKLH